MTTNPTHHPDLGCTRPRDPCGCGGSHGMDRASPAQHAAFELRQANLALEPIPCTDHHFDSVSAYDFLEHVPRVLPTADGQGMQLPFVELMNEVWRVLRPGGLFYALTPAYPHGAAFHDPTQVNIVADHTQPYFRRPTLGAHVRLQGPLNVKRVVRVKPGPDYEPLAYSFGEKCKRWARERRGALSHLVGGGEVRRAFVALLLALALPAFALEVNTASQAELEQLKGIGVEMSERLLKARAEAPFKDWDDLKARVTGMGERTAERLSRQGLTVQGHALDEHPETSAR